MGRKRIDDSDELLIHHIQARLSTKAFNRLSQVLDKSQCASMGELVRKILTKEKIICYYKDTTLDTPIEELIKITKELNAIGVNINQITKHFHQADHPSQKMFDSLKVAEQYKEVGVKVDRLLTVVFELSKKWLQESTAEKASAESSTTINTK